LVVKDADFVHNRSPQTSQRRMRQNPFVKNGKPLVSKVVCTRDLKGSIDDAVSLIGGIEKLVDKGDAVLLKPNYNTADPFPGSSDPDFIKAVIERFYEAGAGKVIVGERSAYPDTWKVLERAGIVKVARQAGAEVRIFGRNGWRVMFDKRAWRSVRVSRGRYLRRVSLAREAFEMDKIVYLPLIKTHHAADFTGAIKLSMGFVKPFFDQMWLHARHLREKLAELMLVVKPDLTIMDARKVFITGGPANGEMREPNLILASGNQVAIDVEGVKILQSYPGNDLKDHLWNLVQIKHAVELGEVPHNEEEYEAITP
jgi:uncharacterized protein (DUF362 family)